MADRYGYQKFGTYDSNSMAVNNGVSDYNAKTSGGAFTNKAVCELVVIRTNYTITVKINSETADAITVASTDSPFEIVGFSVTNLFISNASGSNATVQILNA